MKRRTLVRLSLAALLTVVHFFYAWRVGLILYKSVGGIQKIHGGWTSFGGAGHAWTIPLQIPGTLLLLASGSSGALAPFGILLLLLASLITGYAISSIVVDLSTRHRISWGRFYWRAAVILLGLAWTPVREDLAFIYQFTVRY